MAVSRSKKIITVSEYVKSEISARFKTRAEKIIVTHEGVDATFASELSSLPSKPDAHYFLYVGNAHPHKNLKLLFKAFFDFRIKHPDYRLVCVGKPNFFWNELQACAIRERLSDSVDFLGYVSDEKLKTLYAEATSFIFPSLSEGFGLPILEAMSAGCPVMCSRVSSLPEIAGSAALYFDPESLSSLTESMELIVADSTLRSRLISSGLSQVTNFSWQRMAQKTLEVYK